MHERSLRSRDTKLMMDGKRKVEISAFSLSHGLTKLINYRHSVSTSMLFGKEANNA